MVLVRIYGNSTEKFIDREAEIANMELLHANGLAPPIYAKFGNGIAYGFIPGRIVNKSAQVNTPSTLQSNLRPIRQGECQGSSNCEDDSRDDRRDAQNSPGSVAVLRQGVEPVAVP